MTLETLPANCFALLTFLFAIFAIRQAIVTSYKKEIRRNPRSYDYREEDEEKED